MAKKSLAKKQNTLFSFFSVSKTTEKSTKATQSKSSKALHASAPAKLPSSTGCTRPSSKTTERVVEIKENGAKPTPKQSGNNSQFHEVQVGTSLSIYWPDDDCYYDGKVTAKNSQRDSSSSVKIIYEDGEVETVDLAKEKFKILETDTDAPVEHSPLPHQAKPKKLRIPDDSDEENEFIDEEGSEFCPPEDESEDDHEGDSMMMITDEDDDEIGCKSKPSITGKKRLRITPLISQSPSSESSNQAEERPTKKRSVVRSGRGAPSFITPPSKNQNSFSCSKPSCKQQSPDNLFSSFSKDSKSATNQTKSQEITPPPSSASLISTASSSSGKASISSSTTTSSNIPQQKNPLPVDKVVNPHGTHYHNHFTFLKPHKRRDAQKRSMSHPDYNPRTLYVDYTEMERVMRHTNAKCSPGARQWWELKSQYADTLLLFKTGKFYEIFHMDADVAVQVLGFAYMKGTVAHAGFPEIAYGGFCEKLVKAGYKVARIEQTETPEMLKERKKNTKKGKKPSVVNREVCSIVTAGTRTFCYLDDLKSLENEGHDGGVGPLLAIKEIILPSPDNDQDTDEVVPVCEYGIALIDAVRGTVTLGQFADDVLRTRMNTLLTTCSPSEILVEGGSVSPLMSLIMSVKNTILPSIRVEMVNTTETLPASTAVDEEVRRKMQRPNLNNVKPWDVKETIAELHRKQYYPRSSRKNEFQDGSNIDSGIGRWPEVLRACIKGGAELALSAFGGSLFYLQRNLIDDDILSMGIVKPYCPIDELHATDIHCNDRVSDTELQRLARDEQHIENCVDTTETTNQSDLFRHLSSDRLDFASEASIDHLALDGTTIANLEILTNSHSNTVAGSLWSKINSTKSPHGSRILKAWLLRPLFRKHEIERRADAVSELSSGSAADAMSEARVALSKCGDIERLLSRIHSMGGIDESGNHPNERAVLYEMQTHTKRKVEDFSKLLNGLRSASTIPEMFEGVEIQSGLLSKVVRTTENNGFFPSNLTVQLDWFYDNFDVNLAKRGQYEPSRGVDESYDHACDEIERIKQYLNDYRDEYRELPPSTRRQWKYANMKEDSKDKYLIELPVACEVPSEFILKGKRGKGHKQINKYRTSVVEELVEQLETAIDLKKSGKDRGIKLVFAKFDSMRHIWASVSQATAMLDALGSLAEVSSRPGYHRPTIAECSPEGGPLISVKQGIHPCVDQTHSGGDFIPNDLSLGQRDVSDNCRVLLLSGPNMGGKSTLLRQTCLIAILAQIGCFVPAEECRLTPFDRIFTRLGASDRILLGQSTFFVELAETAAALRGATRRSLVIMDELGRGTSTFDGTAIASATVKHLVERNGCLSLFATHYHSLLDEWKDQACVRLGHMECLVNNNDNSECENVNDDAITFLYTLGKGSCPRSFGINVARLAGLPEEVLVKAKKVSTSFEATINHNLLPVTEEGSYTEQQQSYIHFLKLKDAFESSNFDLAEKLWEGMQ